MQAGDKEAPVIQLHNVYRTYEMGDQVLHALAGVNVNISRNEYVAIVGASGSGKSTMMNIILWTNHDETWNTSCTFSCENFKKHAKFFT